MAGGWTKALVVFTDADTGQVASAEASNGTERYSVFERLVRVSQPMSAEAAQQLANEIAEVLGGDPPSRYYITIRTETILARIDGTSDRASEIQKGDRVEVFNAEHEQLHVDDLTIDENAATVLLQIADAPMGARLDLERGD